METPKGRVENCKGLLKVAKTDRVLVILLRFLGMTGLCAIVTILMPLSWMEATHRWLGLGKMPSGPVVEYMARSLSAVSILLGSLFLMLASDVKRYKPVVRFFGAAFALMSPVACGIDLMAGMPSWWSTVDLTLGMVIGAWLFCLAYSGDSADGRSGNPGSTGIESQ